jgi:hypothetical protein
MTTTKKLISTLLAGATLGLAAPVFADSWHHDRDRYYKHSRDFDRHGYRDHHGYRGYARRPVIVERPYYVTRPVVVEQPVYYSQPAPSMGLGATIGAAIGAIYDNQR